MSPARVTVRGTIEQRGFNLVGHHITIVEDDALPEGHDFVYVTMPAGVHIFYRRSTLDTGPLEDSWAAYRALARIGPKSPARAAGGQGQVVDLAGRRTG